MIYVLAAIGATSILMGLGVALAYFLNWKDEHDKHHRYIEHLMKEDKESYWKS